MVGAMSTSAPTGADPASSAVEMVIEPRERPVGSGTVRRLLPFRLRRTVGPFIFCDVMGPEEFDPGVAMNVDAHPHIGLSTLTYLVSGRAVHRDSTGAVETIEAGAVNWMTAGSGVTHTERGHPDDLDDTSELFGVQTWVALPTTPKTAIRRSSTHPPTRSRSTNGRECHSGSPRVRRSASSRP